VLKHTLAVGESHSGIFSVSLCYCSVLQCFAVCWSVLQRCVAVYCSAPWQTERATRGYSVRCSVIVVCCSVVAVLMQCVAAHLGRPRQPLGDVCCSVLQCVAVCCSVLQCVAVSYSAPWQTERATRGYSARHSESSETSSGKNSQKSAVQSFHLANSGKANS